MTQNIDISWQMSDPPIAAKNWRKWTVSDFAQFDFESVTHKEMLLNSLTEYILKQALKEHLPRSTGWQYDPILSPQTKTALKTAAGIYKRGVSYSENFQPPPSKYIKGSYPVQVTDSSVEILTTINSDNFLVVDRNVYQHHKPLFAKRSDALIIQLDEHSKNLDSVRMIIAAWEKTKKEKTWCLVGGGILTDTAAFAAHLCQSESVFVPTTLLAMADACVGGKTGVNAQGFGKNLIGRFYFPREVLAWPGWLSSLDQRQIQAGAFECLKHYLLNNDLQAAASFAQLISKNDLKAVAQVLPTVIKVKAEVVEQDPAETGKRAILNLGHTLGHAVEGVSQKFTTGAGTILHGEAVGVGMMFAIFLSTKLSGLSVEDADVRINILKQISKVNVRPELCKFFAGKDPESSEVVDELKRFITQDKKATGTDDSQSEWILLSSNGEVKGAAPNSWTYTLDMTTFPAYWQEFLKKHC